MPSLDWNGQDLPCKYIAHSPHLHFAACYVRIQSTLGSKTIPSPGIEKGAPSTLFYGYPVPDADNGISDTNDNHIYIALNMLKAFFKHYATAVN